MQILPLPFLPSPSSPHLSFPALFHITSSSLSPFYTVHLFSSRLSVMPCFYPSWWFYLKLLWTSKSFFDLTLSHFGLKSSFCLCVCKFCFLSDSCFWVQHPILKLLHLYSGKETPEVDSWKLRSWVFLQFLFLFISPLFVHRCGVCFRCKALSFILYFNEKYYIQIKSGL